MTTIELTTDDLAELQEAAAATGCVVLKTQTSDGDPVWLRVQHPQPRAARRARNRNAAAATTQ